MQRVVYLSLFLLIFFELTVSCVSTHNSRNDNAFVHLKKPEAYLADSVLLLINQYRQSIHLNSLEMKEEITVQALQHSKEMGDKKVLFGHDGFDNRVAAIKSTMGFIYGWAENVAAGQSSAKQVVYDWLHSAGHKKNIEGNYNYTGIGIYHAADGMLYYTQIFIRK